MNRNLKALGLALLAALAMSTMGATAAFAEEEGHAVTANGGTHESSLITATDTGQTNQLVWTMFEGSVVECAENVFHGEIDGGTTKEVTVDTTFGGSNEPSAAQECVADGFPMTVANNGCHLTLDTFETHETAKSDWEATADLTCPGEANGIEWRIYLGSHHETEVCNIVIPPQNGIDGFTLDNEANGTVRITAEANNITVEESGFGCGSNHDEAAELHGEVLLTATSAKTEEQIDASIEHTEP